MKNLVFLSGTRADFGKIEPLAKAAEAAGYGVTIFVTGMHMQERYGLTKLEVHAHFDRVSEFINQRHGDPTDIVLAKTVLGFSDYLEEAEPDLVLVHGDRVEALATAIVCATKYVRCVHIEGGEVSGTIDEIFRHCNTKLASAHLVSSESAKRRVMALGEEEERIHVIGSPELDIHIKPSGVTLDQVRERYQIGFEEYGIAIFHPVTSETDTIGAQARQLFGSLNASGRNFVIIAPNNDPGSDDIFRVIDTLPRETFRVLPSMRFRHFSELMKNAAALIGNSSTVVREAPFLGVPSLDIGTRQTNRAISQAVKNCPAADDAAIQAFLRGEWGKPLPRHAGFGTGGATDAFVALLNANVFWTTPMQKKFRDVI
ncbi:MAG: UDP-N-acetylglucosamine 2-epimerase [Pseudomonadota bacterium]